MDEGGLQSCIHFTHLKSRQGSRMVHVCIMALSEPPSYALPIYDIADGYLSDKDVKSQLILLCLGHIDSTDSSFQMFRQRGNANWRVATPPPPSSFLLLQADLLKAIIWERAYLSVSQITRFQSVTSISSVVLHQWDFGNNFCATWTVWSVWPVWQAQDTFTLLAFKVPLVLYSGWAKYARPLFGGMPREHQMVDGGQPSYGGSSSATPYISSLHSCITD